MPALGGGAIAATDSVGMASDASSDISAELESSCVPRMRHRALSLVDFGDPWCIGHWV